MAKKYFYALAGINGMGVYTDYSRVLQSRQYLKRYKMKGFASFEEATYYARTMFKELQYEYGNRICIPEIQMVNWIYFRKYMMVRPLEQIFTSSMSNKQGKLIKPFIYGA